MAEEKAEDRGQRTEERAEDRGDKRAGRPWLNPPLSLAWSSPLRFLLSSFRSQCLSFLDPSGLVLDAATRSLRDYLRHRPDTVRCVLQGLTDTGGSSELSEELSRPGPRITASGVVEDSDDEEDGAAAPALTGASGGGRAHAGRDQAGEDDDADALWYPASMEAERPRAHRHRAENPDIVSALVSIFGSPDPFLTEYRRQLSAKLLTKEGFDTEACVLGPVQGVHNRASDGAVEVGGKIKNWVGGEGVREGNERREGGRPLWPPTCTRFLALPCSETRVHELLKIRFGDDALNPTEVMVRCRSPRARRYRSNQGASGWS